MALWGEKFNLADRLLFPRTARRTGWKRVKADNIIAKIEKDVELHNISDAIKMMKDGKITQKQFMWYAHRALMIMFLIIKDDEQAVKYMIWKKKEFDNEVLKENNEIRKIRHGGDLDKLVHNLLDFELKEAGELREIYKKTRELVSICNQVMNALMAKLERKAEVMTVPLLNKEWFRKSPNWLLGLMMGSEANSIKSYESRAESDIKAIEQFKDKHLNYFKATEQDLIKMHGEKKIEQVKKELIDTLKELQKDDKDFVKEKKRAIEIETKFFLNWAWIMDGFINKINRVEVKDKEWKERHFLPQTVADDFLNFEHTLTDAELRDMKEEHDAINVLAHENPAP